MSLAPSKKRVLIIGASARAAAYSACKAGLEVHAIDLFNDLDLEAVADSCRVDSLDKVVKVVDRFDSECFIYTGCLENRPELIERISAKVPLFGNSCDTLTKVRDPSWLEGFAARHQFNYPEVLPIWSAEIAVDVPESRWLRKPKKSGGGMNIVCFDADNKDSGFTDGALVDHRFYFQRLVEGLPVSAAFVSTRGNDTGERETVLLGVSKQLIGQPESGAGPFSYCGSIGPMQLDAEFENEFCQLGKTLAIEANLVGLFGVDAMLTKDGLVLIEVNPRYTASMEVIELGSDICCVEQHMRHCAGFPATPEKRKPPRQVSKLVQFSKSADPLSVSEEFVEFALKSKNSSTRIADIPPAGTMIMPGHPMFSVISIHESEHDAIESAWAFARKGCDLLREQHQGLANRD